MHINPLAVPVNPEFRASSHDCHFGIEIGHFPVAIILVFEIDGKYRALSLLGLKPFRPSCVLSGWLEAFDILLGCRGRHPGGRFTARAVFSPGLTFLLLVSLAASSKSLGGLSYISYLGRPNNTCK